MEMNTPIQVWPYDDAPKEYQELCNNGGDEDWIALIPKYLVEKEANGLIWFGWLEDGGPFGCHSVKKVDLPNGDQFRIGCHS